MRASASESRLSRPEHHPARACAVRVVTNSQRKDQQVTVNQGCSPAATNNFTLDRDAFAAFLCLDGDDTRYGLCAFGSKRAPQIAGATKRALACGAITLADGAQLHVFPAEGTSVAITVRDLPPTATQLAAR